MTESEINQSDINDLKDIIRIQVKAGFENFKAIYDMGLDFLYDKLDRQLNAKEENFVKVLVDSAFIVQYLEQKKWDTTLETDTMRLEEAFAELQSQHHILAAMHFTCCQTCGHEEMKSWLAQSDNQSTIGYVFWHSQDTESMIRNGYLYLAFGSRSQSEETAMAVANTVCDVLRKHGIEVDWAGAVRTRIKLPNIVWQYYRSKELDYADA